MKNIKPFLLVAALLIGTTVFAQDVKPVFEKDGELIKATFFYEDGTRSQEGTFKNGKLHGKWVSYNIEGEKTAIANYTEGIKTGKWFFWTEDRLTEVDYDNNKIAEVTTYSYDGTLVTRD